MIHCFEGFLTSHLHFITAANKASFICTRVIVEEPAVARGPTRWIVFVRILRIQTTATSEAEVTCAPCTSHVCTAHASFDIELAIGTARRILLYPFGIRLFFQVYINQPLYIRLAVSDFQSRLLVIISIHKLVDYTWGLIKDAAWLHTMISSSAVNAERICTRWANSKPFVHIICIFQDSGIAAFSRTVRSRRVCVEKLSLKYEQFEK